MPASDAVTDYLQGVRVGNMDCRYLGNSQRGVYGCRHADVLLNDDASDGPVKILVCKVCISRTGMMDYPTLAREFQGFRVWG